MSSGLGLRLREFHDAKRSVQGALVSGCNDLDVSWILRYYSGSHISLDGSWILRCYSGGSFSVNV